MAIILLAEPDRQIRDFMAGILADCGHAVEACADGEEAISSLGARKVDVVVTDLMLSRELGPVFGANCAALGIPMVTLSGGEYRPGSAVATPSPKLLEKPFRFADLRCVLRAVASRSGPGAVRRSAHEAI